MIGYKCIIVIAITYCNKLRLKPLVFFSIYIIIKINQQRFGYIKEIKKSRIYKKKIKQIILR